MRKKWTEEDDNILRQIYPDIPTQEVAEKFGCTKEKIHRRAARLGIKKSEAFYKSPASGRLTGKEGNFFQKGHKPWCTGMKGIRLTDGSNFFKHGHKPHHQKPIGSIVVSNRGFIFKKIDETGIRKKDWAFLHVLVWEEHNGHVPENHLVIFKDGDKSNVVIGNLECISRKEHMLRNSVINMPKELQQIIHLRGTLVKQINKRIKNGEENN